MKEKKDDRLVWHDDIQNTGNTKEARGRSEVKFGNVMTQVP